MKNILVVYHSQQKGNTRKAAELIAAGARRVSGVEVQLVNTNEARVDMGAAEAADAYALGSPDYFSYVAGGLKQFFDDLHIADLAGRKVQGKPCVLFLTHGGGGKAIEPLQALAAATKLQPVAEPLICQGEPAGDVQQQCTELGTKLAEHLAAGDS